MSASKPGTAAMVAILIAVVLAPVQASAQNVYNENFSTTTYEDTVFTTADWNTVDGELKMFPLPLLAGSIDIPPSGAKEVVIAGDRAYVAADFSGLQIVDITDPANPAILYQYDTTGRSYGVAVAGNLAFVADAASGLQIINITSVPSLVGTYNTPGTAYDVAVAGDLAFVADVTGGLRVINISNPASPTLVSSAALSGNTYGVAVAGDLVFAADYASGLRIIDITNPSSPAIVGTYNTSGFSLGVAVSGDFAYVADTIAGLQIIDISNPASPVLVGTYDTPDAATDVAVDGDLVFIADGTAGFLVIDASNPASPTLVGTYDSPQYTHGVAVAGEHAYVATAGGLEVMRVARTVTLSQVGGYVTPSYAVGVEVAGDLAFVVSGATGLQVIDISDPASPTLTGACDTPGDAGRVAVSGNLALVADDNTGVKIIDVSNPATPAIIGTYSVGLAAHDVAVDGDYAFVAADFDGLRIIDISNPASPALVGSYQVAVARAVAVDGDYAFVMTSSGLYIIGISNPASPALVGSYVGLSSASDVAIAGDLAFVTDGAGLKIINISNPSSPVLAGTFATSGPARSVAVDGDLAFVCDIFRLWMVDITSPSFPVAVGSTAPGAPNTYGVAVAGDLAFVAGEADGLQIFRALQHEVDTERDFARSLTFVSANDMIVRARLTAAQTPGILWTLYAPLGFGPQTVPSDNTWTLLFYPVTDLQWMATLAWSPGVNPTVSDLTIEWLTDFGPITAITDVPNDQGGRVYLNVTRSGYDFAEEATHPVTQYGIYRRVDGAVAMARVAALFGSAGDPAAGDVASLPGVETVWENGTRYVRGSSAAAGTFPPGIWALVQTVPATQSDSYLAEVTTAADSSETGPNPSVYIVTTHTTTPSVWFVSHPDSGWSVDNLAPSVPTNLVVAYNTGSGNTLTWDESPDADFRYFSVYRATDPNFTPPQGKLLHTTTATSWSDPAYDGWPVHYKVTATDFAGNESDAAGAVTTTGVGDGAQPRTFALRGNVPNPFNPTTLIRYDVPAGAGRVTLAVYDVGGHLVRTLVSGAQPAGERSVLWDGADNAGNPVSSGVYFCRMQAAGFVQTHKMVLLK